MLKKDGPWRITFDTNPDDCNLNCIMCEDHSPYSTTRKERVSAGIPKRRMDMALLRRILKESQGSNLREIIPSTMGEPLVFKHFEEILELCAEYNIKLNLTTNGTFPHKGAQKWAELIVPVTSDVKISWNAAKKETQEKIMIGSNWEKVLDNLQTFIRFRDEYAKQGRNYCTVTLQLTFLEMNYEEIPDVVQLGINYGVDRIKGHHLWAHFNEIKALSMRRNSDSVVRWNNMVKKAYEIADSTLLPNGKKIRLENINILEGEPWNDVSPGGECPFLGKEAWVAHDGRFNPCCAPDKLRRGLGEFGNLNDTTIAEIWSSDNYQNLRDNYMRHEVCQQCNMRKLDIS